MYFLSIQKQCSTDISSIAASKYTLCQLCTSGTHQSGNTDYFAFMYLNGYVIHYFSFCIDRMIYRPVLYFHADITDLDSVTLRETVCNLTANHTFDDTVFGKIIHALCQCLNGRTISDNCDLICYIRYFIQLMRDNDTGHSIFFEFQKQIQQCLGI